MNDNILQNLLYQVNAINKKYENIAEITGENFNIFNILGLTTNEVRTHSAFIAELLNPKGSHGCKYIFLKLFIEEVIEEIRNFINKKKEELIEDNDVFLNNINEFTSSENCSTIVEQPIGLINESYTEGGRIDILIRDQNNHEIIIENKIYAGEQQNQLIRYYNYNSQAPIIYLTLFEEKPTSIKSEKKELKENKDFFCITYKKNILNWLEKCRKEAVNHSLLRETISQYINLIKLLTNQTINDNMNEEVKNLLLKNYENFYSSQIISNSFQKVINEIKETFIKEFNDKVDSANFQEYVAQWKDYTINCFIGDDYGYIYGFSVKKGNDKIDNNSNELKPLIALLKSINNIFKENKSYIGWIEIEYFKWFDDHDNEMIFKLSEKKNRVEFINKIILDYQGYIDRFRIELNKLK